ncbi:MAG: hypothetical protein H6734_11315 [Alphaproteobacteria bacterium]|nr:hypothetical protein [Alphaproteobacteria bacterium]
MDPMLPSDAWSAWSVVADRLLEAGDLRGELLLLDAERAAAAWPPDDDDAMTALIAERIEAWLDTSALPEPTADAITTHADLRHRVRLLLPVAPPALLELAHRPTSQLLALAGTGWPEEHLRAIDLAVIAWIEEAFDGVPPPDTNHRTLAQAEAADGYMKAPRDAEGSEGRWQDLDDGYLLACQWALPHLDAQGMRYYLPAIMRFAVRHLPDGHPADTWLTESLEYTLDPQGGSEAWHRERMALLDAQQAAAIGAFCWRTGNGALERWVARGVPADRRR